MASTGLLTSVFIFCLILFGLGFIGWLTYTIVEQVKSTQFEIRAQVADKVYEPSMKQFIKEWRGNGTSAVTPVQFPECYQLILAFDDGKRSLPVSRATYKRFRSGDCLVLTYRRSFLSKDVQLVSIDPAEPLPVQQPEDGSPG